MGLKDLEIPMSANQKTKQYKAPNQTKQQQINKQKPHEVLSG